MATGLPSVLRNIIASYISDLELDDWIDRSKLEFMPISECSDGLVKYNQMKLTEDISERIAIYIAIVRCSIILHPKINTVDWSILSRYEPAVDILKVHPERVDMAALEFNYGIYQVIPKSEIVRLL